MVRKAIINETISNSNDPNLSIKGAIIEIKAKRSDKNVSLIFSLRQQYAFTQKIATLRNIERGKMKNNIY